jgi:hypothetical protein
MRKYKCLSTEITFNITCSWTLRETLVYSLHTQWPVHDSHNKDHDLGGASLASQIIDVKHVPESVFVEEGPDPKSTGARTMTGNTANNCENFRGTLAIGPRGSSSHHL